MKVLSDAITSQKNKISTAGAWLTCIEITYTGETTLRFVNNTVDIVLAGATYTKWAFGLGQVKESIKGELPRISLALYDVDLTLRTTMQTNRGWSGGEVTVRRIFVDNVGVVTDTGILQYFTILSTTWDDSANTLNFSIGISTPLSKRFPRDRQSATICRHKFRDGFCRFGESGADGDVTTTYAKFVPKSATITLAYIELSGIVAYTEFGAGQRIRVSETTSNNNESVISSVGINFLRLGSNFDLTAEEHLNDGTIVRILAICDHSITDCRALNNSHKFGASPGMSGGLYG